MNNIKSIIFIVFPLILFHELGHFSMGVYYGKDIVNFSIGFGPSFYSFEYLNTVFNLRVLPLGGFVYFENLDFSINPYGWLVILFMGPLFNLLIALNLNFIFYYKVLKKISFNTNHSETIINLNNKSYILKDEKLEEISLMSSNKKLSSSERIKMSLMFSLQNYIWFLPIDPFQKSLENFYIPENSLLKTKNILGPFRLIKECGIRIGHSYLSTFNFTSKLSYNLFIINLLPIFILDGGRILHIILNHHGQLSNLQLFIVSGICSYFISNFIFVFFGKRN